MVFSGLVTDWRLATVPTSRSPVLVKATTDGVVRPPSWFGMTTAWPPSMTETTELVVPKSIPMILLILPSIFRLGIRLALAWHHYQTLVCCCQVGRRSARASWLAYNLMSWRQRRNGLSTKR